MKLIFFPSFLFFYFPQSLQGSAPQGKTISQKVKAMSFQQNHFFSLSGKHQFHRNSYQQKLLRPGWNFWSKPQKDQDMSTKYPGGLAVPRGRINNMLLGCPCPRQQRRYCPPSWGLLLRQKHCRGPVEGSVVQVVLISPKGTWMPYPCTRGLENRFPFSGLQYLQNWRAILEPNSTVTDCSCWAHLENPMQLLGEGSSHPPHGFCKLFPWKSAWNSISH